MLLAETIGKEPRGGKPGGGKLSLCSIGRLLPVAGVGAELGGQEGNELRFPRLGVHLGKDHGADPDLVLIAPRGRQIVEWCLPLIEVRDPVQLEWQRPGGRSRAPLIGELLRAASLCRRDRSV